MVFPSEWVRWIHFATLVEHLNLLSPRLVSAVWASPVKSSVDSVSCNVCDRTQSTILKRTLTHTHTKTLNPPVFLPQDTCILAYILNLWILIKWHNSRLQITGLQVQGMDSNPKSRSDKLACRMRNFFSKFKTLRSVWGLWVIRVSAGSLMYILRDPL
jgi:hypothetical protein